MKKVSRNMRQAVRAVQIELRQPSKGMTRKNSSSSGINQNLKNNAKSRSNSNLIVLPKSTRQENSNQENKENCFKERNIPNERVMEQPQGKISRSKSQMKLYSEKSRELLQKSRKPVGPRNANFEDQDSKGGIMNYIARIEKNVDELKECIYTAPKFDHSSVPNIPVVIPLRNNFASKSRKNNPRILSGNRYCKSSSNLRMISVLNRQNLASLKNIKPRKKVINISAKNTQKKQARKIPLSKSPSIKEISRLYQMKRGQPTNNIVELYAFYVELMQRECPNQQSISKKTEYQDIYAENYLLPNDSATNTYGREESHNQKADPQFVLYSQSLDILPELERLESNSITTQFSKMDRNSQKVIEVRQSANSNDCSHQRKSQSRHRYEIRDLFECDAIKETENDVITSRVEAKKELEEPNENIINLELQCIEERKQIQDEVTSSYTIQKMLKNAEKESKNIDLYIEQCIRANQQLCQKKKSPISIPLNKKVIFTQLNLVDISDEGCFNDLSSQGFEEDDDMPNENTLSEDSQLHSPSAPIEYDDNSEQQELVSQPNHQFSSQEQPNALPRDLTI